MVACRGWWTRARANRPGGLSIPACAAPPAEGSAFAGRKLKGRRRRVNVRRDLEVYDAMIAEMG